MLMMAMPHEYDLIPPAIREGIDRWVQMGVPPGSFLRAVLENDLFTAMGKADMSSMAALPAICGYVWNETPHTCWGSREKCDAWQAMHVARLRQAENP